ncbi:hypothetical protein E4T52_17331 [Aureobasidium sp. EXF-3400]|nr:hypothetical protein E4T52_17331 [Aureobasidium sp. EXF-3400]
MTSAAAEKEINKWQLWGVNKLLEVNVSLSLTQEKNGNPPTLDLVKQIYHENEEEAKELLKDAQSSLKHMDIKWVIFGACAKLYVEAGEAYLRFRKLRDLNNMSMPQFIKDYLPAHIMEYNFHPRRVEQGPGSIVDTSTPEFKIDMFTSSNLFEQVEAEMTTATPRTPQTLFELIKLTSYKDYNASSQGWHDENKLEEMADEDMRYLVVRLEGGHFPAPEKQWTKNPKLDQSIIGFLSFMITQEEDENVVYIYEIHISEHYREYGLGRHLFSMVEHIGKVTGMDKAMLTVFKRNTHARRWYDARGYSVDEISPRPRKLRGGRSIEPDYEILSKRLQERADKRINRDVRC